ncbi:hypothetical protein ARMGADRAFT_1056453 [Armillaria gallica]|uniref:Uncharacterized protein n=1 Tax=Armillaria gallica TaxID=47427 RepID=A0A2H3EUR7_ARMGA|nr:hypothetical protein ARMGADRAFT_1056453 [Armillaria gallica]
MAARPPISDAPTIRRWLTSIDLHVNALISTEGFETGYTTLEYNPEFPRLSGWLVGSSEGRKAQGTKNNNRMKNIFRNAPDGPEGKVVTSYAVTKRRWFLSGCHVFTSEASSRNVEADYILKQGSNYIYDEHGGGRKANLFEFEVYVRLKAGGECTFTPRE